MDLLFWLFVICLLGAALIAISQAWVPAKCPLWVSNLLIVFAIALLLALQHTSVPH